MLGVLATAAPLAAGAPRVGVVPPRPAADLAAGAEAVVAALVSDCLGVGLDASCLAFHQA